MDRMDKTLALVVVIVSALGLPNTLAATTISGSNAKPKIIYRKSKTLDFEDSLIRGKVARPAGDTLSGREDHFSDVWMKARKNFRERIERQRRAQR